MANLSTLLNQRLGSAAANVVESNLEQGQISVYYPATEYGTFRCGFCWQSPGTGIAVIEIWGAGGSGAKSCCCGVGIAGNAGGYSKRTVEVTSGAHVCGYVGLSCGNASTQNFRGCSEATCITVCTGTTGGTCYCMCAQGGFGGYTYCIDGGSSMACCFWSAGFPRISDGNYGGGCGIVINCVGSVYGCAFGGDVNICGGISCTSLHHCNACCMCSMNQYIAIPPGIFSECGAMLYVNGSMDSDYSQGPTGTYGPPTQMALNSLARDGVYGAWFNTCWNGGRTCQCYEMQGCVPFVPFGMGGPGASPCPSVRDHGWRGGHGAVRIKFIG